MMVLFFLLIFFSSRSGGGASQEKDAPLTSTAASMLSSIAKVSSKISASKTPYKRWIALWASVIELKDKA